MTVLPRAATSPELVKLRSDNQSTRLYLTVHTPATVYTARLAAVPSSTDQVASITYNTGSGTHTNIIADQTLLIGSTAGDYDVGIARIRNTTGIGATTGTFNIGETSEINWTSNAYLTVVDDFGLWPRHIRIDPTDGTTPLMDYNVEYADQNLNANILPVPLMGPPAVLWLNDATVSYTPDGSNSWLQDGTITGYSWTASGASATSGLTTATPTFTYNAVGTYRIALTVTGSNSVTNTGYRYVFVVTSASGVITQFNLDSCGGDVSTGGWSFGVTCYAEVTRALVRDRALCILHAVDYYGDTQGSVGYVTGSENVIAVGHIAGESITWNAQDNASSVTFTVEGPQYWLGQMTAFPSGVKDVDDATTPNKWTKFQGLTLNRAWFHFMAWRCTATRMMDVHQNTDSRRHKRLEAPGGQNIWAQLIEIARRSLLANPICDRYGRIFLEIDQQFVSDRSSFPVVQALTSADWQEPLNVERVPVDQSSLIDLSGIAWDGTTATPFFSLAPGHVFNHYGSVEVVDRLMLIDQSTSNTLAGLYSAWRNNEYPKIDVNLAANHRLFDITPYQRFTLAIASTDTPRGVVESLTLIPRNISYTHNADYGYLTTSATFEAEVTADLAVTGDTPADPPDDPIIPIDPPIDPPPIDDPIPNEAREMWMGGKRATGDVLGLYYASDFFAGGQPTWNKVAAVPALHTLRAWCVALDGSAVYVIGKDGASDTADSKIWRCVNPKAVSPTWTVIADNTTVVTGGYNFYTKYGTNILSQATFGCYGATLYCYAWGWNGATPFNYMIYGEYTGGAWSWSPVTYAFSSRYNYRLFTGTSGGGSYTSYSIPPQTAVYNRGSGVSSFSDVHRFFNGNARQVLIESAAPTVTRIIDPGSAAGTLSGSVTSNFSRLTGSVMGTRLYMVNSTGVLHVSIADANFETRGTSFVGSVFDGKLTGGGALVSTVGSDLANFSLVNTSNEFIRISRNGTGNTWESMTGNFWTTIEPSIASVAFTNPSQPVF